MSLPRPLMADTQRFFTGKLYVLVHMLKLPAEELLWSALPQTTQEQEVEGGGRWEVFHMLRSHMGLKLYVRFKPPLFTFLLNQMQVLFHFGHKLHKVD